LRVLLLALVSVYALSGCSTDEPPLSSSGDSLATSLGLNLTDGQTIFDSVSVTIQQRESDFIQTCMLAEGFEYTLAPVKPSNRVADSGQLDEEAYVAQHGFGIAASLDALRVTSEVRPADPNEVALRALSVQEREQWSVSLANCRSDAERATEQIFVGLEPLGAGLSEIPVRIASDDRVISAEEGWADCMAQRGYSYPTRARMKQDLESQFHALMSVDTADAIGADGLPTTTVVDQFQIQEVATAIAWYECSDTLRTIEAQVRQELEQELLSGEQFRQAVDEFRSRSQG